MDRIESIILRALVYDNEFMRRVLPFVADEYFTDRVECLVFTKIKSFIDRFNVLPTKEALIIDLNNTEKIVQEDLDAANAYLNTLESEKDEKPNSDWLSERAEVWCRDQAMYNAAIEAINIMDGKGGKGVERGVIPKLFQDALSVSFDSHIGHDYFEDAEARYDFYHRIDNKIPFHLDYFNKFTKNGIAKKTLNICLAGTNVGKSLFMCDLAAFYLSQDKKVLYITMEMAEVRIAERIDANMMNRPIDDLEFMAKEAFLKKIKDINSRTQGKLIIKEYPTSNANVNHFRALLEDLWLKKQFKPDAIFIDYLNICSSSRIKAGAGMYELIKAIAEELRGLAVEYEVPVWSATQMNRAGYGNADPDLTHTSESFGLPATADFMFALVATEELATMNQLLVKILKNRTGQNFIRNEQGKIMNKFAIGVDRSKQKLYNLEEAAQENIAQDELKDILKEAEAIAAAEGESATAHNPIFEIDLPPDPPKTKPATPTGSGSVFDAGEKKQHKLNV